MAGRNAAVVMGDVVSSRSLEPAMLHDLFNAAVARANLLVPAQLLSPLTITLGDEFQGLARTLATAAELARAIRLDLLARGVDCRLVIGTARLETPLNVAQAWNMMGEGLAEARGVLNARRDLSLYRFSLPGRTVLQRTLDAVGAALTQIERRWTVRQRETIIGSLDDRAVARMAAEQGVVPRSVYKVRQAGGFDLYAELWSALAAQLAALDAEEGRA
jgi:hypothetical protein